MRSAALLALLLTSILLAGCSVAPRVADEPSDSSPEDQSAAWTLPYTVSDCQMVTTIIDFDIDRAREFLPPGYEPTEGGNMFGAGDAETGAVPVASLNVLGMHCPRHDLANGTGAWLHASIDIQPPKVANQTSPSPHNVYDVLYATDEEGVLDPFRRANLPVVDAEVVQDVALMDNIATGALRVTDDNGTLMRLEVAGAGPAPVEGTAANWHQTNKGVSLTHMDGHAGTQFWSGRVTACELQPGSALAQLVGTTDCREQALFAAVAAEYTIDHTLTFLPATAAEGGE